MGGKAWIAHSPTSQGPCLAPTKLLGELGVVTSQGGSGLVRALLAGIGEPGRAAEIRGRRRRAPAPVITGEVGAT